jgi:hypothetical protein
MKNNYFIKNITKTNNRYSNNNNYLLSSNLLCALQNKNVVVSNINLSEKENLNNLELNVFYRANKIKNYKLKFKTIKKSKKLNTKLTELFKKNNLKIKLKNLNKLVAKGKLTLLFKKFKNYLNRLFLKRTSLFCDFLKIILLVANKKASVWSLVYIMSLIFKPLQKRQHGMFVSFINEIFNYLLKRKNNIIGIKMIIAGRLKGKPRSSYAKTTLGKISLTENKANIETAQHHIYTIYGCFGLKLWINFKN